MAWNDGDASALFVLVADQGPSGVRYGGSGTTRQKPIQVPIAPPAPRSAEQGAAFALFRRFSVTALMGGQCVNFHATLRPLADIWWSFLGARRLHRSRS